MVIETSLRGDAIIRATVQWKNIKNKGLVLFQWRKLICSEPFSVWTLTLWGSGSLWNDDVRVTSELLQRRDGALTHHRLPAERTVVNHLQHDGRGVHLILWKELNGEYRQFYTIRKKLNRFDKFQQFINLFFHNLTVLNSNYHLDEEDRAGEVGALFHALDDRRLHPLPPTLHHETGWRHSGQLERLHVSQTPCKNLKDKWIKCTNTEEVVRTDTMWIRSVVRNVDLYLHSCELHHRPNALRNHEDVFSSLWRQQGKIWLSWLQTQKTSFKTFNEIIKGNI